MNKSLVLVLTAFAFLSACSHLKDSDSIRAYLNGTPQTGPETNSKVPANPETDALNTIRDHQDSGRYLIANEETKAFRIKYPNNKALPELELFNADKLYEGRSWKEAQDAYRQFLIANPNSPHRQEIEKRIAASQNEIDTFHSHFDWTLYWGTLAHTSQDYASKTNGTGKLFQLSLSLFFKEHHGVYVSKTSYRLQGKKQYFFSQDYLHDETVDAQAISLGYLHRLKVMRKTNIVYGVGLSQNHISVGNSTNNPLYPQHRTLGFHEFLEIGYCMTWDLTSPCWSGTFPSIAIFHSYIPDGRAGNQEIDGHLVGMAVGVRL